jgi:hypothetical protein
VELYIIGRIAILLRGEKSRLAWPQIFLRWLCMSLVTPAKGGREGGR